MRTRPGPASVITAAVLLLGSGAVAGLLPGVGLVNRRMVVDARQPPWNAVAKVQTNDGTRCTGALVGRQIVITAAHCLYNPRTHGLLRPSRSMSFSATSGAAFSGIHWSRGTWSAVVSTALGQGNSLPPIGFVSIWPSPSARDRAAEAGASSPAARNASCARRLQSGPNPLADGR